MRHDVYCLNCGRIFVYGEREPLGTGYLPGTTQADTCYICRPDLDTPAPDEMIQPHLEQPRVIEPTR